MLLRGFNYKNDYNFIGINSPPHDFQSTVKYIQDYLLYDLDSIRSGDSFLLTFDEKECKVELELEDDENERFKNSLSLYYKPRKNIAYLSSSYRKWSENELNNPTKFTCDLDDFKKLANIFQKFYLKNWKIE